MRKLLHKKIDKEILILIIFFILYISYFSLASFLRYENFYAGRFDLGNMAQTVWNTSQGKFFVLTNPNSTEIVSRLAFHADFLLVLLAPFYLIWPDPRILLLIQTIVLASGCFFVYFIALHLLRNKTMSLVFALCYLCNPSLQRSNLYDFHAVVLASTLLLGSWYFLLKKRYILFTLFALLAALTKEQVWITVALLGAFISLKTFYEKRKVTKETVFGIAVFITSTFVFYFLVWHAIPQAHGKQHFALEFFSDYGSSPKQIIKQIFFSPEKTITIFLQPDRIDYFKQLFAPFGYFSILGAPLLSFVFHDLLINTLSSNKNFQQIYYQYTATLTPFLLLASIYGVKLLRKLVPSLSPKLISIFLLLSCIYASYLYGPMPWAKGKNLDMFTKQATNSTAIENALRKIPRYAKVAASNALGSHLSNREYIFTIPNGTYDADYVGFLLSDTSAQPSMKAHRELNDSFLNNPNYILIAQNGDFFLYRKRGLSVLYF